MHFLIIVTPLLPAVASGIPLEVHLSIAFPDEVAGKQRNYCSMFLAALYGRLWDSVQDLRSTVEVRRERGSGSTSKIQGDKKGEWIRNLSRSLERGVTCCSGLWMWGFRGNPKPKTVTFSGSQQSPETNFPLLRFRSQKPHRLRRTVHRSKA